MSPTATSSIGMSSLRAVADHASGPDLQSDERADRFAGAGLRPRFEQTAEEDQRDDHADGLVVDVAQRQGQHVRRERDDEAVGERRGRSERDERVHLRRAVAERDPAGAVDRPAGDRSSPGAIEDELEPRLEQDRRDPVGVEELVRHRSRRAPAAVRTALDRDAPREVADLGARCDSSTSSSSVDAPPALRRLIDRIRRSCRLRSVRR